MVGPPLLSPVSPARELSLYGRCACDLADGARLAGVLGEAAPMKGYAAQLLAYRSLSGTVSGLSFA
jgi:hypothetical protein